MSNLLLCPANLEAYLRDLPVSAAILPRLQALLLRDDTYLEEVSELVRLDPALATAVMRVAGSVFHGRGREVRSLEESLIRLGMRETYRVTAAFAMGRFLNSPLRVYGLTPAEYWRQSLGCAFVMEEQAPVRWLDECVAYTVGLLHALGMVFIDRHLRRVDDPGMQLRDLPHSPLPRQEARLTGMNHAQVAAFVLRRWDFGTEIVEPVACQYDPARAIAHPEMTALLAESRTIAREIVATLPPPVRPGTARVPAGDESELHPVARKILALESWTR